MTAIHESSPQHQTIQAHVVEEIMPDQLTEVTDVKEVINQLLPTRKRKPRTKKPNGRYLNEFHRPEPATKILEFFFCCNNCVCVCACFEFCSPETSHHRWNQPICGCRKWK